MGYDELFLNFEILCKHFGTVPQCSVDPTVPVLLTTKSFETSQKLIFGRHIGKIGICLGNRLIADFLHDQTIFIKDC